MTNESQGTEKTKVNPFPSVSFTSCRFMWLFGLWVWNRHLLIIFKFSLFFLINIGTIILELACFLWIFKSFWWVFQCILQQLMYRNLQWNDQNINFDFTNLIFWVFFDFKGDSFTSEKSFGHEECEKCRITPLAWHCPAKKAIFQFSSSQCASTAFGALQTVHSHMFSDSIRTLRTIWKCENNPKSSQVNAFLHIILGRRR